MSAALASIPGQTINFTSPNFIDKECTVCMPVGISKDRDLSFQMLNNEVRQLQSEINNLLPNPDFINANNFATEWIYDAAGIWAWNLNTSTQRLEFNFVGNYSNATLQTPIIIPAGETFYFQNELTISSSGLNNPYVFAILQTGITPSSTMLLGVHQYTGVNTFSYTNNTNAPLTVYLRYMIQRNMQGYIEHNYFGPLTTNPLWPSPPPFLPTQINAICQDETVVNLAPYVTYSAMGSHLQITISKDAFEELCCAFVIQIMDRHFNLFISEPLTIVQDTVNCYKGLEIKYFNTCNFGAKAAPLEDGNWYWNSNPAQWANNNVQYITYLNAYAEAVTPEVNNDTYTSRKVNGYFTNYEDVITRSELRDRTNINIPNLNHAQIEQLRLIFMHNTIYVDGQKVVPAGRLTYKKTGRTYEAQIQVEVMSKSLLVNNCCC